MRNPYLPELAFIKDIEIASPQAKIFTISFRDKKRFECAAGQFVEISLFGYGEFPASVSEVVDADDGCFKITIRGLGKVTSELMELPVNSVIGIRGPFGNGFPIDDMNGRDILLIAGGMGISPIKSAIHYILSDQARYGQVTLLYGAVTPNQVLHKDAILTWKNRGDQTAKLDVLLTVDEAKTGWQDRVGLVTELIDEIRLTPNNTSAIICGPSLMMQSASSKLLDRGLRDNQIFLSFERRMQCGMGMCGHCMIGWKRVCQDGPVFSQQQLKDTLERVF